MILHAYVDVYVLCVCVVGHGGDYTTTRHFHFSLLDVVCSRYFQVFAILFFSKSESIRIFPYLVVVFLLMFLFPLFLISIAHFSNPNSIAFMNRYCFFFSSDMFQRPVFANCLSRESEWPQVTLSLRDPSEYSRLFS